MKFQIAEELKNSPGVYLISHEKQGPIYVGATQLLHSRYKAHYSTLRAGNHTNPRLQAAVNEHGIDGLLFTLLEVYKSGSLSDLEEKWLKHYGSDALLNRSLNSGIRNPTPSAVVPVRLDGDFIDKLDVIAKQQRRTRSQMLRVLVEDAVAAYEKEHGPIAPAPTT